MDKPLDAAIRSEPVTGVARAVVRTAIPLDEGQRAALQALCREHYGLKGDIAFEVDPAVLGGVWLRIGDYVIDGSVAGKLDQLHRYLRESLRASMRASRQVAP